MAVETEEWNQARAVHRPLAMMRHIALDALAFDNDEAFYTYARLRPVEPAV